MENVDVAGLPRHLVKQSFNHLLKITNPTKKLSDPFGDDSKPRSYDVTFSNLLFDFNDDYTLCYDNPLFDEEFEEISSLDPPELTPVIDESTLLVTLTLPYLVVLGDEKIDLLLRDDLVTLLTRDREIDFNPCRDIEELECLLANDPVLIPRAFDEPLGNSDSMSRQFETSDLILEELTTEIGLDDSISTDIDDRYYDSEESSSLVPPLPDPKQIFLREVERFDPFFSLTQSGEKTRVIETPSFSSHHKPSPRPDAYSLKVVMYCYYHPHLTSSDGFDPKTNSKIPYDLEDLRACFQSSNHAVSDHLHIPSGESKVHIEVLLVLWGNRLPIPDGSLPLSRYKGLKTKQKRRLSAKIRRRLLIFRDQDQVDNISRAYHWKEHEILSPTVPSLLIGLARHHLYGSDPPIPIKAQV
ncbi:hypothetical protein Tco_1067842 [Tanacetum coccineum]|uniref:Reverse transcriptase domain-containing protein n=1 Tax=Tanacetum coccineum TaxID=301880 RepID=A0ABQ5HEK3_9ASTR